MHYSCNRWIQRLSIHFRKNCNITWIMPGWSRTLFPGHGVPSCIVQPSSGTFCAVATSPFIFTLNSSYSLCTKIQPKTIMSYYGEDNHHITELDLTSVLRIYIKFGVILQQNLDQHESEWWEVTNLHGTPFPDKCWMNFIFQIVHFLRKIPLRGSGLNIKFFTERNPFPSKFRCLRESFKCEHGSTIIWHVACNFIHRIINRENREDSVRSDQWRFFHRVYCTYENIYTG